MLDQALPESDRCHLQPSRPRNSGVVPSTPSTTLLGVQRSISDRHWALVEPDGRLTEALAQRLGLPEIVARVLAGRGIGIDEAPAFLDPRLRTLLPDPCALKDMRAGAERLAAAIVSGERIAVFGDYDVDGATAAALLLRFLAAAGAIPPRLYVPDRLREGYGPNAPALRALAAEGVRVVVTVDCGIAAHQAIAAGVEAGVETIVVDHHQGQPLLPPAVAVINPNRLDESGSLGHLAAVGVAFLLAVDTNRLLREAGWYARRTEPDLRLQLGLVALGTVCDMVPLRGVNRAFVAQGLKVMAVRGNPGLRALADLAGLNGPPTARDLGFALGPRINAGGRVGESELGARLLSTDDPGEAEALARRLDALNRERQAIEQSVLATALDQVSDDGSAARTVIWADGDGWHPGVIGIVASRLVERFRRPAVVIARTGDGRAVASARSLPGIDLGAAVNAAVEAGLLLKGGGHAMAAGFTAEAGRLAALCAFLSDRLAVDEATGARARALPVDGVLSVAGAAALPPATLATLAPFGAGHPEPRFVLKGVRIVHARPVAGGQHVACTLEDGGARLSAIAFRCGDQPLGRALAERTGAPLHIAGRLQPMRGNTSLHQLIIDDAADVAGICGDRRESR